MALKRRQERKFKTLMRSLVPVPQISWDANPATFSASRRSRDRAKYFEVYHLAHEKGLSEDQLRKEWMQESRERLRRHAEYRLKPVQSRQDNKDQRVGSGGSNRTTIRFPKECRKTAWKRFWKLFPALDGCRNWDDYNKKCQENPDNYYLLYSKTKTE